MGILFLPSLIDNPSHTPDERVAYPVCHLNQGSCTHRSLLFGDVTITVSPNDFPTLVPLSVMLFNNSVNLDRIIVSLDGKDMFMGVNQAVLAPTAVEGHWEGVITIPVCTVDKNMVWLFSVTLMGHETERLAFTITSKH